MAELCGDDTDQPLSVLNLGDASGSRSCIKEAEACRSDHGGGACACQDRSVLAVLLHLEAQGLSA
jgi:hypothetical protein